MLQHVEHRIQWPHEFALPSRELCCVAAGCGACAAGVGALARSRESARPTARSRGQAQVAAHLLHARSRVHDQEELRTARARVDRVHLARSPLREAARRRRAAAAVWLPGASCLRS
eukprot:66779-Prymnesium_polylepis.1